MVKCQESALIASARRAKEKVMRSSCALCPLVTPEWLLMDLSIVVKELSFKHQNGASALENVSFSVKPGSRVLLIGSNGAGKVCRVIMAMNFINLT